jgi:hypothetical protein
VPRSPSWLEYFVGKAKIQPLVPLVFRRRKIVLSLFLGHAVPELVQAPEVRLATHAHFQKWTHTGTSAADLLVDMDVEDLGSDKYRSSVDRNRNQDLVPRPIHRRIVWNTRSKVSQSAITTLPNQ